MLERLQPTDTPTAIAPAAITQFTRDLPPRASRIPLLRTVDGGRGEPLELFAQILDHKRLTFEFQPIVDLKTPTIFGYEALMRGPLDTPLRSPDALLDTARRAGRLVELELVAASMAIRRFGRLRLAGQLFVNLSAPAILAFALDRGSRLFEVAMMAELAPARLIFELTEHERVDDPDTLASALDIFKAQGIGLALDDFGDGRSSLRLWSQLEPDIVKLDKYFISNINHDSRKVDVLRSMLGLADKIGSKLLAEGIEGVDELAVIRDLGCPFGQGYALGRPCVEPAHTLPEEALSVLASTKIAVLPNATPRRDLGQTVGKLLIEAPVVSPETTNEEVRDIFARHRQLHAVAVVENSYPIGLIDRRSFLDRYAQRYFSELYGRQSCVRLMNPAPFRVDQSQPLDSMISTLAGADQRYLFEGFILTNGGHYAGIATGESLVRAVTERRVEAARHANPLTLLPGNIPITQHITRLLDAGTDFASCYFDLNNFKPFNDCYGYWRGDEMIKLAAEIILAKSEPAHDFVGHVGGDDFVVLFQSDDWQTRCHAAVGEFNERARGLFNSEDLARDGFESEDRQGTKRFFPLTTIAVGAVRVAQGQYDGPEEVASAAAAAKKFAKQSPNGFHLSPPAKPIGKPD